MKKFNQSITIEIEVDTIAEQLLNVMSPDAKHREIITEAIITTALHNDSLTPIYNAINGNLPAVNFELGEYVMCSQKTWKNGQMEPIGKCLICEIDPYSKYLTVSYEVYDNNTGKMSIEHVTTLMKYCDKIPTIDPVSL